MKKFQIAKIFDEMGDILEIKGDNPFNVRAYRRAARNIESLTEEIETLARADRLTEIGGIGNDLGNKIKEFLSTGKVKTHERLKKEIPEGLLEVLSVPDVGPKTVKLVHEELGVKNIDDLEKVAKQGKIAKLPGFKYKSESNIRRGIQLVRARAERMPLGIALTIGEEIISHLKQLPEIERISPAGSLRRMKETVRDIDILITSEVPERVMELFTHLPQAREILACGDTKSSILTEEGIQVDLRVVRNESFGAALCYFTGSKAHNINIREMAMRKGLKINEYGVFRGKRRIAGKDEEEIYKILGLRFIQPELREDRGEIEASIKGRLPRLLKEDDIRGDLHVHTKWSDGVNTIAEMAETAKKKGLKYIAICDHSESLGVAGGLDARERKRQLAEIKRLNKKIKGFKVLAGAEVDILGDGTLDMDRGLLEDLDIVVAAIHSGFRQAKDKLTDRIVSACETGLVDIIAHPTGRLMGARPPYEINMEKVLDVATDTNTALEINAYTLRLDLNDIASFRAKEKGVMLAVDTDAHNAEQLNMMSLGVAVARRAWLEKRDVLNTLSADKLLKWAK